MQKVSAKEYLTTLKKDIIAAMKKDGLKWFKPFVSKDAPKNAVSNYVYSGVNYWNLNAIQNKKNFKYNLWASYLDWQKVNAKVIDSHVAKVLYYGNFIVDKKEVVNDSKKTNTVYFLKATPVFNVEQVDLSNSTFKIQDKPIKNEVESLIDIDNFVKNTNIKIEHSDEGRCYYNKTSDFIHMTNKENFLSNEDSTPTINYYSTLFHELIHATGHFTRLNRFKDNDAKFKDDKQQSYAFEELIAETGSVLLSQHFGIEKTLRDNHAIYLKSWISALENDTKFLTSALTRSYKAYEYYIGVKNKQILKDAA
jgi:antirestriction protein ArdC